MIIVVPTRQPDPSATPSLCSRVPNSTTTNNHQYTFIYLSLSLSIYIYVYMYICVYIIIIITIIITYIIIITIHCTPTKSLGFGGFDSSRLLILRGGNSHVRRIW